MNYLSEWNSLAARIQGFIEAGRLHASFQSIRSGDTYGSASALKKQCGGIVESLRAFRSSFLTSLPTDASKAIDAFIQYADPISQDATGTTDTNQEQAWRLIVASATFAADVTHLLANTQHLILARSELAFAHLQRSIAVDADICRKWGEAFADHETKCEKLGAVHLLSHGIYAFKAHAEGGRTDLIFPDIEVSFHKPERYSEGIVLTEWKRATSADEAKAKFTEARKQAKLYAAGPLAGCELTSYRFVVVVTEHHVPVPEDILDNGVNYRHINIVVDPEIPSKRARGTA